MKYFIFIFSSIAVLSCGKTNKLATNNPTPPCTQKLIDSATAKPKGSLFTKIESYLYIDKTVYLFTAGCCDRYNEVKDENCVYLFSPSGGFTGKGDQTHPNFFTDAKLLGVIWEDKRQ
jgi:hypothetical protein